MMQIPKLVMPGKFVALDNIKVYELDCPATESITFDVPTIIPPGLYEAKISITANSGNLGVIQPVSTGEVVFKAGTYISLNPTFHSQPVNNGRFYAFIEICNEEEIDCDEGGGGMKNSTLFRENLNLENEIKVYETRASVHHNLEIFPNPNLGSFQIKITTSYVGQGEKVLITVYNSLGESVFSLNSIIIEEGFNVSNLEQGAYTVVIRRENSSEILTQRVIVITK